LIKPNPIGRITLRRVPAVRGTPPNGVQRPIVETIRGDEPTDPGPPGPR
jgi:hypothetical protein